MIYLSDFWDWLKVHRHLLIVFAALTIGIYLVLPRRKPEPPPTLPSLVTVTDTISRETAVVEERRAEVNTRVRIVIPPHTTIGDSAIIVEVEHHAEVKAKEDVKEVVKEVKRTPLTVEEKRTLGIVPPPPPEPPRVPRLGVFAGPAYDFESGNVMPSAGLALRIYRRLHLETGVGVTDNWRRVVVFVAPAMRLVDVRLARWLELKILVGAGITTGGQAIVTVSIL